MTERFPGRKFRTFLAAVGMAAAAPVDPVLASRGDTGEKPPAELQSLSGDTPSGVEAGISFELKMEPVREKMRQEQRVQVETFKKNHLAYINNYNRISTIKIDEPDTWNALTRTIDLQTATASELKAVGAISDATTHLIEFSNLIKRIPDFSGEGKAQAKDEIPTTETLLLIRVANDALRRFEEVVQENQQVLDAAFARLLIRDQGILKQRQAPQK